MLKINDIVAVKPGTKDPDFDNLEISGWQGRITEVDTSNPDDVLIDIEWDAATLKNMPTAFLKACFRDGYDHGNMTLGISDVVLVEHPTISDDRSAVIEALSKEYAWEDMGEQGQRIKAIEDACEDDFALMDHWFEHLENNVKLPVTATYIGDSSQNLRYGDIIKIDGFLDTDDDYGVIGTAKNGRYIVQLPLCDIQLSEITHETQALDDYITWFVNR